MKQKIDKYQTQSACEGELLLPSGGQMFETQLNTLDSHSVSGLRLRLNIFQMVNIPEHYSLKTNKQTMNYSRENLATPLM